MKKRSYIFYTLFFIIAVLFEMYCFLELRKDLISIVCGGLVVLIAGFLLVDVIVTEVNSQFERINYFQKGIYQLLKKQQLTKYPILDTEKKQDNLVEDIRMNQIKMAKAIVRLNKSSMMELYNQENQDRDKMIVILEELNKNISDLNKKLDVAIMKSQINEDVNLVDMK